MNSFTGVFSLFAILFVCTLDGYSMMNYRVPTKRAYVYFAAVTALCLIINSYIAVRWGSETLRMAILFTIGLPYFLLILLITNDKIRLFPASLQMFIALIFCVLRLVYTVKEGVNAVYIRGW